jgi:hypothetical protein
VQTARYFAGKSFSHCPIDFRAAKMNIRFVSFSDAPDMIACDDTDLFGGLISTVASIEFCCQISTSGEGLRQTPVTSVHDLMQPGGFADVRPVIVLSYDAIWHSTSLSVPHKLIVNFMESLAAGDNRISLRQALEQADLKFGYFGTWKWPATQASEFEKKDHSVVMPGLFHPSPVRSSHSWLADFQGHTDSPLAD